MHPYADQKKFPGEEVWGGCVCMSPRDIQVCQEGSEAYFQ